MNHFVSEQPSVAMCRGEWKWMMTAHKIAMNALKVDDAYGKERSKITWNKVIVVAVW